MTDGIVSATGRTVSERQGSSAVLISAIQTSAAINPGNSGGAAAGIGFAIPSDTDHSTVTAISGA